ncbi:unnamed protein product, partial [Mesorhabditis spiculigera]
MFLGSAVPKRTPSFLSPLRNVTRAFNHCLHSFFSKIGYSVGSQPVLFFLLFLLLVSFSAGIFRLAFAKKLQYGFISTRARSIDEQRIRDDFHGHTSDHAQQFLVSIRRSDGGSLLSRDDLDEVLRLERWLASNFTVYHNGRSFVHTDLCGNRCGSNGLLHHFKSLVDKVDTPENVIIDHPKSWHGEVGFLVAHHLYGVHKKGEEEELIPYNSPLLRSNKTLLSRVEMINLYFEAPLESTAALQMATEWETSMMRWSDGQTNFPDFTVNVMGDKVLGQEMQRGGMTLIPHMLIGFAMTLTLTVIIVHKALNAGLGDLFPVFVIVIGVILAPIGAVLFTFGLVGWMLIEIYPILIVLPTLVIAIGVDDAFLVLHCWSQALEEIDKVKYETRTEAISVLLSKVLVEVGPSMLLTSFTNFLAFAVGSYFAPPAIQVFSIVAAIAMLVDIVFEIICFCSLLAVSGRFYKAGTMSSTTPSKFISKLMFDYSKFITRPLVQLVVMGATAMFFAFSVYGAFTIQVQINSTRIIPSDSPLQISDSLLREHVWKEFEAAYVYVNAPPDIGDEAQYESFKSMVHEFEALPRCLGANATMLWLNDYELAMNKIWSFYAAFGMNTRLDNSDVPYFLNNVGSAWNTSVKWHRENGNAVVDSFVFYIGFHNANSWNERAENMNNWRAVADKWKQFNVTVYSENSAVYDGIFNMGPTTYQTAAFTLGSMVLVCMLFVPSLIGVCAAAFAICSISFGVFGSLSWLGFDLDPITMVAIVMSIGFSVDYTAHICYHFHKAHGTLPPNSDPSEYVHSAINAVGMPMIQAAASTMICFLPVSIHPDYTPQVFVTTIAIVVVLGLLHGFLILPSLLSLIPGAVFSLDTKRNTVVEERADEANVIIQAPTKALDPLLPVV